MAAVHHRPRRVDRASGVQALDQQTVQLLPHPRGLPVPEPPPRRHTRAAPVVNEVFVLRDSVDAPPDFLALRR